MTHAPVFESWLTEAASLRLSTRRDLNRQAIDNMMCLSVGALADTGVTTAALAEFCLELLAIYAARAAAERTAGLFYGWYDEQSGTLRFSFCTVTGADELPFRRALRPVDDADELVRLALADASPGLVPWSELADFEADDAVTTPLPPLTVWVRKVVVQS